MTSTNVAGEITYALPAAVRDHTDAQGWTIETHAPWTHVRTPRSIANVIQGWKLHVSATVLSAPQVLAACAPILVDAEVEFKYAMSRKAVREFNDTRMPRGMSGKFLTAYPVDEAEIRALAERLHQATKGLAGPRILSDARLYPDSLVHYRFGAFAGVSRLGNDGSFEYLILDPAGQPVTDRRDAYFTPPPWVVNPFAQPAKPAEPAKDTAAEEESKEKPKAVLLNGRYQVTTAVRHANKGGIYLARDTHTGADVIIKEGRPHVATDDVGRDARDVIRHEGAILARLAPLGLTPALVEVFEAQEHVFLVEEKVPGVNLIRWVNERLDNGLPLEFGRWWDLAARLADLLARIHSAGVVLRDFNPNNVFVDADGGIRLIDLEMAYVAGNGDPIYAEGGTPGCSAPEQFEGAAPDFSADVYSLGATLFLAATAQNPETFGDEPQIRSFEELIEARLRPPLRHNALPEPLVSLLTDLMRKEPRLRPALTTVQERLQRTVEGDDLWRRPTPDEAVEDPRGFSDEQWTELVDGTVAHLAATIDTGADGRLWPTTPFGRETEPCAVQYGAGGVLGVLARLQSLRPSTDVEKLLTAAHDWIAGHARSGPHLLPGMQFGAAGTALALHDAATVLGRPESAELARGMLLALPRRWPNPDITHGATGTGSALLTLWQRSGDDALLDPVAEVAAGLLAGLDRSTMTWTVAKDFASQLAGYCSYGFAHGTAGIAAFLLSAGQALGREDLVRTAEDCGAALAELAVPSGTSLVWHEGPGKPGFLTHWCNGASGVASFLIRLSHMDPRYTELTVGAARAILANRWRSGTAYCHGLAGDGDLIIDLAAVTGDPLHALWAREMAASLYDRRVYRGGNAVIPNESGLEITAEFGAGLAGVLAFLLRLRHGGSRLFHPPVLDGPLA